jgi:hypothetical protein
LDFLVLDEVVMLGRAKAFPGFFILADSWIRESGKP